MTKPQDFALILNGVMWLQVTLASVFVAFRVYTRYHIIRAFGWDDVLMLVTLVTFILFAATTSIGISYGVGKTTADIKHLGLDGSKAMRWEIIGQAICIMGIAASKSSVALFLLRIVLRKWHIALLWFCIASTTVFCTVTTTLLFLQCRPTSYLWDWRTAGGYCWFKDFADVGISLGAWSATMDFVLALLPWHIIMHLKMKRKDKFTIAVGLSLGMLAGACSIVRTIELQSLSSMTNYVYDTSLMLLWSSSEVCFTIICACIPVLRPLYVRLAHGSRGESSDPRSYRLEEQSHARKNGADRLDTQADGMVYMGLGAMGFKTTVRICGDNTSEEAIMQDSYARSSDDPATWDLGDGLRESRDIVVTTTVTSQGEEV